MNWQNLTPFERLITILGHLALGIIVCVIIAALAGLAIFAIEEAFSKWGARQGAQKTIKAIPRKAVRHNWKGRIY